MPGARLPMRKIRDMLRLTAAGMSSRKIAASLSIGGTTVVDCLQRARAAGVGWPLPEELSDLALEARLFLLARIAWRHCARGLRSGQGHGQHAGG
jgi:hypothetical protein